MTISEKVACLKGLAEGLAIDPEKSKEGTLINVIIDILEEIGMSIEDLEENTVALGEEIDSISDDLSGLEEAVYEDDCCCDDDEDEDFFEVACPNCEEPLEITDEDLEAGYVQCPSCKEKFSIDLSGECDCDDCCDEEEDED